MAMKRAKPVELALIKKNQPLTRQPDPNEGLRVLSQLAGYSLIAASHPNGFLAGLQQIADDRKELQELREFKDCIVCPQCGRRSTYKLASPHFPHHTNCQLRIQQSLDPNWKHPKGKKNAQ
jgi:hypothetical protein